MKRYCMVNVIQPDHVEEYVQAHRNPWREVLEAIRDAGTGEERIYLYKNLAILVIECEDMDAYMEKFANSEVGRRWLKEMSRFLGENDFADENGNTKAVCGGLRKVFDLNQQLAGEFQEN